MRAWITLATMVVGGMAFASGDRIVVLSPTGAPQVREQLLQTLCVSEECVAPESVLSGGKLDRAKVAREKVSSVVSGKALASKKSGAQLQLTVMGQGGKAKHSQKVPLNDENKLAVKELVSASAAALESIDTGIAVKDKAQPEAKAEKLARHGKAKSARKLAARLHGHERVASLD